MRISTAGYTKASENDSNLLQPFNSLFVVLTLSFLFVSYVSRVVSIFTYTSTIAQLWLKTKPRNLFRIFIYLILKLSNSSEVAFCCKLWAMLARVIMTIYVLLKVVFEIGQSMLWEVSTDLVMLL